MTEKQTKYKHLRFLPFKDLLLWDVKRMLRTRITSSFPIVKLGTVITEQNNREKIYEKPNDDFKILGVNNKVGLFDAYIEKGKNINQPYKKVEQGWLTFNPYRINVGSIGIKLPHHRYDYISPAYVVFSCKTELLPVYLFLLFKTDTFNTIIRENTTGSVRQNLLFTSLLSMQVPLPSLSKQKELVDAYSKQIQLAERQLKEAEELENTTDELFLKNLGLTTFSFDPIKKSFHIVQYKSLYKWDIFSKEMFLLSELSRSKYPLTRLGNIYNFVNRSWNKRNHKNKFFNYVEIGSVDTYNNITKSESIEVSKAPSRASQFIRPGDLLIATTRPYLKKFAIVSHEYDNCICSSGFSVIQKNENYNLTFLKQFLLSQFGVEQLKNKMTGALYPAITEAELKNILIPLPSKNIQDEIMAHLDSIKTRIKTLMSQAEHNKTLAMQQFEHAVFDL